MYVWFLGVSEPGGGYCAATAASRVHVRLRRGSARGCMLAQSYAHAAPSARTCTASRARQARRPRAYTARLHVARYMLHVMLLMLPTCCQCSYVVGGRVDRALQRFESLYAPAASRAFKSDRVIARCHIECRCSNAAKSVSVKSARLPLQQASESVSMRRTALNLDTVRELPKLIPLHHCRAQPL